MDDVRGGQDEASLRRLLCDGGRGVLISQWFTNGALGSTWLPGLLTVQDAMAAGQVVVYVAYCLLLVAVGLAARRTGLQVHAHDGFVLASVLAMAAGDAAVGLAGLGVAGAEAYILGMCLIGPGMVAPVMSYGEYYCRIGERRAAIAVCAAAIAGTFLLALVAAIGSVSPIAAVVLQVACIPLAYPAVRGCWSFVGETRENYPAGPEVAPGDGAAARRLFPFMTMTLLLGTVFGFAIGLNGMQDVASPIVAWAAGMGGAAALVFIAAWRGQAFSLSQVSKALLPVFVLSVYLFPLMTAGLSTLASAVGCAGYMVFSIYYQSCCAALAGTGRVRATPLFAFAVAVDSAGVLAGSLVSRALFSAAGLSLQAVYFVDLTLVLLIVVVGLLSLGDRETASLWGFKPVKAAQEQAEARCLEIAAANGLTLREAEVLAMLAVGTDPFDTAKELGISVTTVRTHTRNIYAKLGIHSQHELIRMVVFD